MASLEEIVKSENEPNDPHRVTTPSPRHTVTAPSHGSDGRLLLLLQSFAIFALIHPQKLSLGEGGQGLAFITNHEQGLVNAWRFGTNSLRQCKKNECNLQSLSNFD